MEQRFVASGSYIVKATPDEWQALRAASPQAVGVDTEGVHFTPPLLVQVAYRSPRTGRVVVLLEAPVNGQLSTDLKTLLGDTAIAKIFCAADGDTDALGCPVRNVVDVQAWAKTGKFGQARSKQLQGLAQLGSQFAFEGAPIKKNKKGWTYFAFIKRRPLHLGWPCLQQQNKLCAYAAADAWMTLEVYDGMLLALARVLPPSSSIRSPSAHNSLVSSNAPPQPPSSPLLASGNDRQQYQAEGGTAEGGIEAETPAVSSNPSSAAHGASSAIPLAKVAPKPSSTNSTVLFSCAACGVKCSSATTLADHCLGRKHLAVLRRLQSLPPGVAGEMLSAQPTGAPAIAIAPSSVIGAATIASTAGAVVASRKTGKAAGKAPAKRSANKPTLNTTSDAAAASTTTSIHSTAPTNSTAFAAGGDGLPATTLHAPMGIQPDVAAARAHKSLNKKKARGAARRNAPPQEVGT